jgi:GH24 family phage-related lysozyme (muramidase)
MSETTNSDTDTATELACGLARQFEGCILTPYQDPVGVWTIGWGETYIDGAPVSANTPPISQETADALLASTMAECVQQVDSVVTCPLNPNQTAALADFVYNEGFERLCTSTLLKLLNQGDITGAVEQFTRWDLADGRVLSDLIKRREAEQALFNKPWVAPVPSTESTVT